MESYHVQIDKNNYFDIASTVIGDNVRIVNLRSVTGHIGIDFSYSDDAILKRIAMNYLAKTDNVELINVLSRNYNGWNWFDAYDSSYNSNRELTKAELLESSDSDDPRNRGSFQIVSLERFLGAVRSKCGDEINPNALKSFIHNGIRIETRIDLSTIDYVPIWHINGSPKTKAVLCELYCPFEIAVHVLAKRFTDFKAKLLALLSLDVRSLSNPAGTDNRFRITKDIDLQSEVYYIHGHPICKLKTVKLNYKGVLYQTSEYGSLLQELLVKHLLRPQRTVELINYLNRLINNGNLFEVYVNNLNVSESIDDLDNYVFRTNENDTLIEQGRATLFAKSSYLEGLTDDSAHFVSGELFKRMNPAFRYIFRDENEVVSCEYTPLYGYISPSGKLSRTAEPFVHLSVVFNVLTQQERFAEINNQEAIASFNAIMKAKDANTTTQNVNDSKLKNTAYYREKSHVYKQRFVEEQALHVETRKQLNTVIGQNAELLKRTAEQLKTIKAQSASIAEQKATIETLIEMNAEQLSNQASLMDMSANMNGKITDLHAELKDRDDMIEMTGRGIRQAVQEVGNLVLRQTVTASTDDCIILYTSDFKPIDRGKMPTATETQIWISSYCGDIDNYKEPNVPPDAELNEIYRINANRLNSFKDVIAQAAVAAFVKAVYARSGAIHQRSRSNVERCEVQQHTSS